MVQVSSIIEVKYSRKATSTNRDLDLAGAAANGCASPRVTPSLALTVSLLSADTLPLVEPLHLRRGTSKSDEKHPQFATSSMMVSIICISVYVKDLQFERFAKCK